MSEKKETKMMLLQISTGHLYAWTPTLAKRLDMRPNDDEAMAATKALFATKSTDAMVTNNKMVFEEEQRKAAEAKAKLDQAPISPEVKKKILEKTHNVPTQIDNDPLIPPGLKAKKNDDSEPGSVLVITQKMSVQEIVAAAKKHFKVDLDSKKRQPTLLKELKALAAKK